MSRSLDTRAHPSACKERRQGRGVRSPGFLVVDDDRPTCELLDSCLRDMGHSRISMALSGWQCFEVLEAGGPTIDVLLLNFAMPALNGLQVMECLVSRYPHVLGVVMITGNASPELTARFLASGSDTILAVALLPKPFTKAALHQATETAMRMVHERRR